MHSVPINMTLFGKEAHTVYRNHIYIVVLLRVYDWLHFLRLMCCSAPGCDPLWESSAELKACYQFNLYSLLTWSQALVSCQSQGASLLSITHTAEHNYIRGAHSHTHSNTHIAQVYRLMNLRPEWLQHISPQKDLQTWVW